ncbi:glucosaminidase domain-containing protein [Shouchella miscanthi]|uniref:glucosaminidase domain-containing protein n=1 Tax=Shouchella miscanthi TaxID=2598861 RepID=UPI0011A4943B|nr:glucosaminidase domain-containing protein [Shouchella miscanthi]
MRNQFINLTSCVIIFLLTFQLVSSNISLAEEERVSDLISIQKLKNNNDGFISVYEDSNLNNLIESIKENDIQNIIKIHEYAIEIEILKTDLEITTGYIGVENFLDEEELNNYYYKVEELGWTISDFLIWINEKDNVDIEDIKEQDRENVNVKEDINEKIEKPEGEQLTINTKEKFDNEEERNEIANVALEEEIITEQSQVELHQDRSLSGASTYTNLLYGLALTNTNVYEFRDKESRVLRSYIIGHILEYRFFDQTWYEATVYLDGEPHTGYIHKDDVENVEEKQVELKGIGKKGPTNVYASATRNGRVLRGYNQGHILRYKTFSESWYEATVYLDGEPHTGYIHKDDVENVEEKQVELKGIGKKGPTNVYASATRNGRVLRGYNQGHILRYKTFSENWYEATVYLDGEPHTGYIHKDDVENVEEKQVELKGIGKKGPTNVYASATRNGRVLRGYNQGHILRYKTFSESWYEATVYLDGEPHTGYIHKDDVENVEEKQVELKGIGKKGPTNVYASATRNGRVLRGYNQGHILRYKTFSESWYEATVYLDGEPHTGYIHKDDVENVEEKQVELKGIGKKGPTNVYASATRNGRVLRGYNQGHILRYKTFSENWYEATVYLDGEPHTGYIHKDDVENVEEKQVELKGIGKKGPTNVYASATRNGRVLRGYNQGHILRYKTFSESWYEATVYLDGEPHTGYIHKDDVENVEEKQVELKGIGKKGPTNVYASATRNGRVLRGYNQGHILRYKTFSENWYEATVYLDGEPHTGYIHKDDVENVEEKQVELKGIGKKGPTNVYASATRNGRVLRGYNQGHILRYKTFSESWYEATVYLDGEPHTGYIHKDDVENSFSYQEDRSNYAMKNNTNVYSQASRSSTVLKSYQRGTLLKYRTFLPNWYEATVYINGKKHTGYIHVDDVGPDKILVKETYTNYNYKFNDLIDIQMTKTPKADGKGLIDANRQQVEYYANPLNFEKGTNEFYQFMVLSESAGVAANDINQRILLNAGILKNQGQTFINAGINYNINEIYLIAHAMHETGNGTSSLARGIVHKGRTVYNMYGIGAYDNCPNQCGAERAYNEGWFTPEAAILGGAQFISNGYVNAGQDTLYKMRWDPLNQGRRQYATHVAWATLQTGRIAAMYKLLDAYSISYDIPSFLNQPPVIVNKSLNIPLEGF